MTTIKVLFTEQSGVWDRLLEMFEYKLKQFGYELIPCWLENRVDLPNRHAKQFEDGFFDQVCDAIEHFDPDVVVIGNNFGACDEWMKGILKLFPLSFSDRVLFVSGLGFFDREMEMYKERYNVKHFEERYKASDGFIDIYESNNPQE